MSEVLTADQHRSLVDNGFLILRAAVPAERVRAARRAVNSSLAEHGLHPDFLDLYRSQTFTPELTRSSSMLALVHCTPLEEVLESAIGEGLVQPVSSARISLTFPTSGAGDDPLAPELDGAVPPSRAYPEGRVENYTALLVVLLNDAAEADSGNLVLWPGTHRAYEEALRQSGPQALLRGLPSVELPEPIQIVGKAGDAVLVHYLTGRSTAVNRSPHIAYRADFKVRHVVQESLDWRESHHWDALTDIWREWPGLVPDVAASPR